MLSDMTDQTPLLGAVRDAAAGMDAATKAHTEAFQARAEAIRAADDAGVDRAEIAAAAGLSWPMSRQRWHQLRNG
jgi:hypothetical protein